jgi:hypothetical protein
LLQLLLSSTHNPAEPMMWLVNGVIGSSVGPDGLAGAGDGAGVAAVGCGAGSAGLVGGGGAADAESACDAGEAGSLGGAIVATGKAAGREMNAPDRVSGSAGPLVRFSAITTTADASAPAKTALPIRRLPRQSAARAATALWARRS